jgi:predicted lysophospholipase L1 biosynthesis ABC-type transport system permease subunit
VAEQTREVALGADRRRVVSEVLRRGALIAGLGCAAGLAAAIAATRVIQSLLCGIPSSDPVTFAAALAAIHIIVLLASYAPVAAGGRRRSGGDFKRGEGRSCRNYSWMTVTVASLLFET